MSNTLYKDDAGTIVGSVQQRNNREAQEKYKNVAGKMLIGAAIILAIGGTVDMLFGVNKKDTTHKTGSGINPPKLDSLKK